MSVQLVGQRHAANEEEVKGIKTRRHGARDKRCLQKPQQPYGTSAIGRSAPKSPPAAPGRAVSRDPPTHLDEQLRINLVRRGQRLGRCAHGALEPRKQPRRTREEGRPRGNGRDRRCGGSHAAAARRGDPQHAAHGWRTHPKTDDGETDESPGQPPREWGSAASAGARGPTPSKASGRTLCHKAQGTLGPCVSAYGPASRQSKGCGVIKYTSIAGATTSCRLSSCLSFVFMQTTGSLTSGCNYNSSCDQRYRNSIVLV